jgi:hypothetical protein
MSSISIASLITLAGLRGHTLDAGDAGALLAPYTSHLERCSRLAAALPPRAGPLPARLPDPTDGEA